MTLTREQFEKARQRFSVQQIAGFEKRRDPQSISQIRNQRVKNLMREERENPPLTTIGALGQNIPTGVKDVVRDITKPIVTSAVARPYQLLETIKTGETPTVDLPFFGEIPPASSPSNIIGTGLKTVAMGLPATGAGAAFLGGEALEQEEPIPTVVGKALTGAAIGKGSQVALKIAGSGITKVGLGLKQITNKAANLVRWAGGMSSKSIKWLKRRGAEKIFDPLKEKVDYIYTHLAPKMWKLYEEKTSIPLARAGQLFDDALGKVKDGNIVLKSTFKNMQGVLKKYGLLMDDGSISPSIKDKEYPRAIKVMAQMYDDALAGVRGKKTPAELQVKPSYFQLYRQVLRDAQKNAGVFKKDIQGVIEGLYDDLEGAGAVGLKDAKNIMREAYRFQEAHPLTLSSFSSKLQSAVGVKKLEFVKKELSEVLGDQTDEVFNLINDHRVAIELSTRGGGPSRAGAIRSAIRSALKGYYEKNIPKPVDPTQHSLRGVSDTLERLGQNVGNIPEKIRQIQQTPIGSR